MPSKNDVENNNGNTEKLLPKEKNNMEKNNLATVDDVRSVIEEEIKIINKNLPIYKYIREFSLTDVPLIKTTTQKIKRHEEMKKIKGE